MYTFYVAMHHMNIAIIVNTTPQYTVKDLFYSFVLWKTHASLHTTKYIYKKKLPFAHITKYIDTIDNA